MIADFMAAGLNFLMILVFTNSGDLTDWVLVGVIGFRLSIYLFKVFACFDFTDFFTSDE